MPAARARIPARPELEELWRSKLVKVRTQYQEAAAYHRKLREEAVERYPPSSWYGSDAIVGARRAEVDALAEYMRVLKIFTDLTVYGKLPVERTPANGG